jgi:hypothetical protein
VAAADAERPTSEPRRPVPAERRPARMRAAFRAVTTP